MKRIFFLFLAFLCPFFLKAQQPGKTDSSTKDTVGVALKQVTISHTKQAVELIPGGYKYNPDKAIAAAAGSIFDLLRRVPGVTVDGSNNIKLQGKSPSFMLNGRKVTLSGNDLVAYLRSINVSEVSTIDVNTNPNVSIDADGEGGVLNIRLKQRSIEGFFGSVSTAVSSLPGTENSVNLNYRKNKWDFTGSYNFSYREDVYRRDNYRENKSSPDSMAVFREKMVSSKSETADSFKGGIAYTIDSTSTITGNIFGAFFKSDAPWDTETKIFNRQNVYQRRYVQQQPDITRNNFYIYDLLYKKTFLNKDQLNIGFNYSSYHNQEDQQYQRIFYDVNDRPIADQYADNRTIQTVRPYQLTTGNIDYTANPGKSAKLDAGMKYTTTNNGSYFNNSLFDDGQYVRDAALSNNLDYNEHVLAAYGMLSGKLEKLSYQVGLRYEDFAYHLHSPSLTQDYSNSYHNIFPSLNLSYDSDDHRSGYSFNLGRRIQRPRYGQLNPFLNVVTLGQYTIGNPYLQPYFVNKAELQFARSFGDGQFIMLSGFASRSKGIFSVFFKYDEINQMNVDSYGNGRNTNQFGMTAFVQSKFTNWFNINAYLLETKSVFSSTYPADVLLPGLFSFVGNLSLNFPVTAQTQIELYGYYVSDNNDFQLHNSASGNISIAAQHKLFKNRLSLSVNVEDIFNLNQFPVSIDASNVYLYSLNKMKSRYVKLGLNYNFGKTFKNKSDKDLRKDSRVN